MESKLRVIFALLVYFTFNTAQASFIDIGQLGPGLPIIAFQHSSSSYDAATDTYTAHLESDVGTLPVIGSTSFTGEMTVSVHVNDSGFYDGTVQWIGGSLDLGVADGSLLYSGNIYDFTYGFGDGSNAPEFHMRIDTVFGLPELGLGPKSGLILYHTPDTVVLPVSQWFSQDFTATPWTHEDFFKLPVPEPSSLALLSLGLAGIGFSCRKKVT